MFRQLSCSFYNEWLSFRYDFCLLQMRPICQEVGMTKYALTQIQC